MKSIYLILIILSVLAITQAESNELQVKRWSSYSSFIEYWTPQKVNKDVLKTTSRPTNISNMLHPLNDGRWETLFEDDIWGIWKSQSTKQSLSFQLDLNKFPEFCGISSANLKFKFYGLEGDYVSASPCLDSFFPDEGSCDLLATTRNIAWNVKEARMDVSNSVLNVDFYSIGLNKLFIIDEVIMTYVTGSSNQAKC